MVSELPPLIGSDALGATLERIVQVVRPSRVVGGWATVELDRAEDDVATTLRGTSGAGDDVAVEAATADDTLGARCRLIRVTSREAVILEPSTEGLLARALASHGEGWLAAYLLADAEARDRLRSAGVSLSRGAHGPFGPQRLVIAGPRSGPFVVVATERVPDTP